MSVAGAAMDIWTGRIFNWLTFPSMFTGLIVSAIYGGWHGLLFSLLAIVIAFALYGWMFWLGVMGAGDVKLLMALGAFGGIRYTVEVAVLGIILGGIMAVGIMIVRKRAVDFAKRIYNFFLTLVVRELEMQPPKLDHKNTMPFGLPISVAAIWAIFADPLSKWGFF